MCGIAGVYSPQLERIPHLAPTLEAMSHLQRHRGPDGYRIWMHADGHVGFSHRRLSIIDLKTGDQPMRDSGGNWITYNGEIYNYIELRQELGEGNFTTSSDTEVILLAYRKWGADCVNHFRGMFSFALWDEERQALFCARDRIGIKPFYFTIQDGGFYFASEPKTLLPFLPSIETDLEAFKDYLAFQFCLDGKTLFKGIQELLPGYTMMVSTKGMRSQRYWQVFYTQDFTRSSADFEEQLRALFEESAMLHLRSDVPVGAYLSGGLDSSLVASVAGEQADYDLLCFLGKFDEGAAFDESAFALQLAREKGFQLHQIEITQNDFIEHIRNVIYHLDQPVAGPGSFPQYMVSQLASEHLKVVLGGQGGDEIFGGYARYLLAYFEQCIVGAIDGTLNDGNFIVTIESIVPNLASLRNYKSLMRSFWADGLFDPMDKRYFRLVNRAPLIEDEVHWEELGDYSPFEVFQGIFNAENVEQGSYFDSMTHFDFKTLLPALLHVEDRMSMAHGLESRVPLLDHRLIELAATIPANIKFKNGELKRILKQVARPYLPQSILDRKDKMGFPVPLTAWFDGPVGDFVRDIFLSRSARERSLVDNRKVAEKLEKETRFGRTIWGLLSLELWQQEFHDKVGDYQRVLEKSAAL